MKQSRMSRVQKEQKLSFIYENKTFKNDEQILIDLVKTDVHRLT